MNNSVINSNLETLKKNIEFVVVIYYCKQSNSSSYQCIILDHFQFEKEALSKVMGALVQGNSGIRHGRKHEMWS